jgi:putative two-component system response regulator
MENFRRGVFLHDIGKMAIPDSILLKPGPLTSDEWVVMKQHPQYAYDLLNEVEYLRPSLSIPYSHHEHWDGSGYPQGLKGTEIPLFARIFMVVDVWDALISDRPYRLGWSVQDVKKYLQENAGKLFDPVIINLFLRLCEEKEETIKE